MAKSKYIEALQEQYTKKDAKSVLRYKAPDNKWRYIQTSKDASGGNMPSWGGITEVTWQELKDKRDNGELNPGSLYRITDYNCTTTQKNTQSAGHQFDIVLLALSENKLAEEGWAMMHDNIYDVVFNDGKTIKCYVLHNEGNQSYSLVDCNTKLGGDVPDFLVIVDEMNKTITSEEQEFISSILDRENLPYNYFQNSNLSAWKVWYCLDNDKSRFAWAQVGQEGELVLTDDTTREWKRDDNTMMDKVYNNETYYSWKREGVQKYIKEEHPNVGSKFYEFIGPPFAPVGVQETGTIVKVTDTSVQEGRGVIYRLIDEWNNDIKYDFKNIQFNRTITDGQYDEKGTETWCYTLNVWYDGMCQDASIVGNTLPNDEGYINGVYDNNFGYVTTYGPEGVNTLTFVLGDNVVLSFDDGGYFGIYSNIIGDNSSSNTIGNNFQDNTIGNYFYSNTIGDIFQANMIGNYFYSNMIGNKFNYNMIGADFSSNTIGNNFFSNTIGNIFNRKTISDNTSYKNYGNNGVELATK